MPATFIIIVFNVDSKGKLDVERFSFNQIEQKNRNDRILDDAGWIPAGPGYYAPSYDTLSGHGIGRLNCVTFHPDDPNSFWIGAPEGGIWKTVNAGQSWMPMNEGLTTLSVSSIAVDPNNTDVIYLGSGDFDQEKAYSFRAHGVFKTTNGGLNWEETGLNINTPGFNRSSVRDLVVSPDGNSILAACYFGVWKSQDGGMTWDTTLDWAICDMKQHPQRKNEVYAMTHFSWSRGQGSWIMKSTDFGDSWEQLSFNTTDSIMYGRMEMEFSNADPDYLYILCVGEQINRRGFHALHRSTDGGETWELRSDINGSPNIMAWYDGVANGGQGTYDVMLITDPDDRDKIYVGGVNVWGSEDGGATWNIATLWLNALGPSLHADQHYGAYRPLDGYFYICNDGGIYRTKDIIPGKTEWITEVVDKSNEGVKPDAPLRRFETIWENISGNMEITQFYRMGLSKNHANYVTAGAQDNSCYYLNSDEDWINYIPNYDGMETMIDYTNPDRIFGAWQFGGLCRSEDGGKTVDKNITYEINNSGEKGQWITPYAMDPNNPDIIYGGYRNLWRTTDGGDTWLKIFNVDEYIQETGNTNGMSDIEISRTDPERIIIYKSPFYNWNLDTTFIHEMYMSRDGGNSFEPVTQLLPESINLVNDIEIDDDNSDHVWIVGTAGSLGGVMYESKDGCKTWENKNKAMIFPGANYAVVLDSRTDENVVYVGNEGVVYMTSDSMDKWETYSKDLPLSRVYELEINYPSERIYAATYGRGVWYAPLFDPNVSVDDNQSGESSLKISPNPSKDRIEVQIANKETTAALVAIIDINGRIVRNYNMNIESGQFTIEHGLNPGVYFINITIGSKIMSSRFVVQ